MSAEGNREEMGFVDFCTWPYASERISFMPGNLSFCAGLSPAHKERRRAETTQPPRQHHSVGAAFSHRPEHDRRELVLGVWQGEGGGSCFPVCCCSFATGSLAASGLQGRTEGAFAVAPSCVEGRALLAAGICWV